MLSHHRNGFLTGGGEHFRRTASRLRLQTSPGAFTRTRLGKQPMATQPLGPDAGGVLPAEGVLRRGHPAGPHFRPARSHQHRSFPRVAGSGALAGGTRNVQVSRLVPRQPLQTPQTQVHDGVQLADSGVCGAGAG